jgi:hypothetical protein
MYLLSSLYVMRSASGSSVLKKRGGSSETGSSSNARYFTTVAFRFAATSNALCQPCCATHVSEGSPSAPGRRTSVTRFAYVIASRRQPLSFT